MATKRKYKKINKRVKKSRKRNKSKRSYKMKRGKLSPLKLIITPEESEKYRIYDNIISRLKYMNREEVFYIYTNIGNYKPKIVSNVFVECDRFIIDVDGLKFYKSTGGSRGTGLEGIWLPYSYCYHDDWYNKDRVKKPEDEFLDDYLINKTDSTLIENNKNNLLRYKRFINEKNAIISKWLYYNSEWIFINKF